MELENSGGKLIVSPKLELYFNMRAYAKLSKAYLMHNYHGGVSDRGYSRFYCPVAGEEILDVFCSLAGKGKL